MGKLTTCSAYCKDTPPKEAIRVLVSRFWPRGKRKTDFDVKIKELSPSKKLLDHYAKEGKKLDTTDPKQMMRHMLIQSEFSQMYNEEMQELYPQILIMGLVGLIKRGTHVILYCQEKTGEFCHRHLLKELIISKLCRTTPLVPLDFHDQTWTWHAPKERIGLNKEQVGELEDYLRKNVDE